MRLKNKGMLLTGLLAALVLLPAGCYGKQNSSTVKSPDAVSSASMIYYEESSFSQEQLWAAIQNAEGGCTIATVNEDQTPDLIIAVPAAAGPSHLFFNWADNQTKANALRTGKAMISYYIYNPEAKSKSERNRGARLKLSLERDESMLEKLQQENEGCSSSSTVFRIEEILPLG